MAAEEQIPDWEHGGVVRVSLLGIDRVMDPMEFRCDNDPVPKDGMRKAMFAAAILSRPARGGSSRSIVPLLPSRVLDRKEHGCGQERTLAYTMPVAVFTHGVTTCRCRPR